MRNLDKYNLTKETKKHFAEYVKAVEKQNTEPSPDHKYEMKRSYELVFTDVKSEKSVHNITQKELDEVIDIIEEYLN